MKRWFSIPWLLLILTTGASAAPVLGGAVSPDGQTKIAIDFPLALRHHNTAGRDGAGLCVFWSITHAARWQKETPLEDLGTLMEKEKGGGWPERVDKVLTKYGAEVDYAQYEGRDPVALKVALSGKRMPCVTYSGRDPHYKGSIAHMVNLVHFDERWVAILDNNYIGVNDLVWMTPDEFLERWRGKGSGWAIFLLHEPPNPPVQDEPPTKGPGQIRGGADGIRYTWKYFNRDPYRVYLFYEDETVGAYDFKEDYFRFYCGSEDRWLTRCRPPFPPPLVRPHQSSGVVGYADDYGIPLNLFPPRTAAEERWTRRGQPASKSDLLQILAPKPSPTPDPPPAGASGASLVPALILGITMLALCLRRKEN
jgi:hypothetical protein